VLPGFIRPARFRQEQCQLGPAWNLRLDRPKPGHLLERFLQAVCGVQTAVNEFIAANNLGELVISMAEQSWFIRIP
jgi:hypothetical protein